MRCARRNAAQAGARRCRSVSEGGTPGSSILVARVEVSMDPEVGIAAASAAVALAAFFLSWRADARAEVLARTQMFLGLRTRFLEVFRHLPRFDKPSADYTPEERAAVLAYWHHAFDEWYITNRLNQKPMQKLWHEFFAPAVLAGMRHDALRQVLFNMIDSQDQSGEYRRSFGEAMKKLWESRAAIQVRA